MEEKTKNEIESRKSLLTTKNFWSGFLFGIGFVSFFDEMIFHQLLHWHHFYDRATTHVGMVADGLFHAFSWFATVGSLFLYADLKRCKALVLKSWLGSAIFGIGVFQLYDGLVQHKIFRIHQIRYGVDLLPYDLTWNLTAILLVIVGLLLILNQHRKVWR